MKRPAAKCRVKSKKADHVPPKPPVSLRITGTTDTSVSLAWEPAKANAKGGDNKGVVGYGLYDNGARVGSSPTTSATISGLACGQWHVFGVDAVDAAGNRSPVVTTAGSTAACPVTPPASTRYVAPNGADYAWTHLAATYDGTNLDLYVNGALVSQSAVSGSILASNDPLRIGGGDSKYGGEWFNGRLDDVRIYSRALSAAEIQQDMNTAVIAARPAPNAAGLAAAYGFDEGAGTTLTDLSGNHNDGKLEGGATWVDGHSNGGLAFDGRSGRVDVPGSSSLVLARGMTLEAWVRPNELDDPAWQGAILKEQPSGLDYALYAHAVEPTHSSASARVWTDSEHETHAPSLLPANTCAKATPCLSFDRAYHAAQPGDVVEVAGGTYGDEDVSYDAAKTSTTNVLFRPAPGDHVTIGDLTLGHEDGARGASHVTFQDLQLSGDVGIIGCGAPSGTQCRPDATAGGDDVTLRNLTVRGPVGFFCGSCSDVSILGGVFGPASYGSPCNGSNHPEVQNLYDPALPGSRKLKRSHNLLIDGVTWQNYSACTSSDHTECLQIEPADDVIIRNSIFRRCDTITVNLANDLAGDSKSAAGYAAPNNVLIENNFFDEAHSLPGAPTYYALNIRECTNCTIRYNSWLQAPRVPDGEVAFNVAFVGNVGPMQQQSCGVPGITWSHDVWVGAQCGATDKSVSDPLFANPATTDLHLLAGSPAIDAGDPANYPATDIDGQKRPLGAAPDAGADER